MHDSRIIQLLNFLKEDPDDAFVLYALATEYLKTDEAMALEYYDQLMRQHPDYEGTYYHAAKLYEKKFGKAGAEKIYRKGIEICQKKGKIKALAELRNAYHQMMEED